nr:hypothetical protein GCM10020092_004820 [Actinoplanes digitatis]
MLRGWLGSQAKELAERAEELNARRVETFGGQQMRLLGAERIRTENNCVPRDIVQVGGAMLFGYNVFIGLKTETAVSDVFAVHGFGRDGDAFRFDAAAALPGLLDDPGFQRDFAELYRYYRETHLLQLRQLEGMVLAVFQTGARVDDLKVLRWKVGADGVSYVDSRGERDHVFPPSHDFEWVPTTREHHVLVSTRTSPSRTRSSSRRWVETSPSRWRTTPRTARASTPSRWTSRSRASPTRRSRTPGSVR